MLDWMLNVASHPLMPWVSAAVILLWGITSWFAFRLKLSQLFGTLDKASAITETHFSAPDFATSFDKLNKELTAIHGIKGPWGDYSATITHAVDGSIQTTRPPELFFNIETLVLPRIDLRYYQTLPAYLIGAGLVFTFISFVAALAFTQQGLASMEMEVVKVALDSLLNTAVFKFAASIAGLMAGLFFSWSEKVNSNLLEKKISKLCRLFSERVELVTEERIILERIDAIKIDPETVSSLNSLAARSQSQNFEQSVDRMDKAIAVLGEKLDGMGDTANLTPVLESVREEIASQGRDHEQLLQELLGEVTQLLRSQGSMTQVVDEVEAEIERMVTASRERDGDADGGRISEQLTQILLNIRQEIDGLSRSQESLVQKVAEQSHGGGVDAAQIEAILATIREEMAGFSQSRDEAVREAVTEVVARPVVDVTSEEIIQLTGGQLDMINAFNKEAELLVGRFEKMEASIAANLSEHLDPERLAAPVIASVEGESERVAALIQEQDMTASVIETVKTESERVTELLRDQVFLGPVIETVKAESQRVSEQLRDQVFLDPVIETVKAESQRVSEQLRDQVFLDPVIETVKAESQRVSEQLRDQVFLDPVIATVKTEVERVSQQLRDQVLLDPVIDVVKAENQRVSEQLRDQVFLEPVIKTVQSESERVSEQLHDKSLFEPVLDAVHSETALISEQLQKSITLDPVIEVMKAESERLVTSQKQQDCRGS